jgi:carbonic anhydrase
MRIYSTVLAVVATVNAEDKGEYLYSNGGSDWADWTANSAATELDTSVCTEGKYQSPVDMPTSKSATNGGRLQGSYYNSFTIGGSGNIAMNAQMTSDMYALDYEYATSEISLMHKTHYHMTESFTSQSVRFIAPSEHTVDGVSQTLELQVVFENPGAEKIGTTGHDHASYSILFMADESAPATLEAANALAATDELRWGALMFGALATASNGRNGPIWLTGGGAS